MRSFANFRFQRDVVLPLIWCPMSKGETPDLNERNISLMGAIWNYNFSALDLELRPRPRNCFNKYKFLLVKNRSWHTVSLSPPLPDENSWNLFLQITSFWNISWIFLENVGSFLLLRTLPVSDYPKVSDMYILVDS